MNPVALAFQADGLPALLLVVGGGSFVVLAAASAGVPAAIWTGPPEVSLPLIARHLAIWRLANLGFVIATVLTAAGLFVLPPSLGANGAGLALAGAVAYAMAGTAWIITLGIRLGITPDVATRYVASGSVDPAFAPLAALAGALFATFIVIGCSSLAVLGVAALLGGTLPAWVGWTTLGAGAAILAGFLVTGDTLPAFVYLPTILLGVVQWLTP